MNRIRVASFVLGMAAIGVTNTNAIDVGDPLFAKDVTGNMRLEVLYEKYDRDVKLEYGPLVLTGPGGAVTLQPDNDTSEVEGDIFMLRATIFASDTVSLYANAGILDDSEIKGTAYIVGGGFRVLAYEKDEVRVSVFGSVHYVPSYDSELSDFDPDLGQSHLKGSADYYEATAGAILSRTIVLDEKTAFIPYGGFAISILRGDVDATIDYPDAGIRATLKADIKEDKPVQAIVGGSFLFNENWSLRIEGRFIGSSSISGGIGVAF